MNDLMLRRREMAQASGPAPLIPAEYQQVEYIKSTGGTANGPYFDSGYQPTNTGVLVLEVDCMITSLYGTNSGCPIGVGVGYSSALTGSGAIVYFSGSNTKLISASNGVSATITVDETNYYNVRRTLIATFDGNGDESLSYGDKSAQNSNEEPKARRGHVTLFAMRKGSNNSVSYPFHGEIYHAKITMDGVVVRDLYPCYRKEDDTPGFYDIVTKSFKTRGGSSTATITLGPDVN